MLQAEAGQDLAPGADYRSHRRRQRLRCRLLLRQRGIIPRLRGGCGGSVARPEESREGGKLASVAVSLLVAYARREVAISIFTRARGWGDARARRRARPKIKRPEDCAAFGASRRPRIDVVRGAFAGASRARRICTVPLLAHISSTPPNPPAPTITHTCR
eukprot:352836-Chlamydomonas_euryale.AAC.10